MPDDFHTYQTDDDVQWLPNGGYHITQGNNYFVEDCHPSLMITRSKKRLIKKLIITPPLVKVVITTTSSC